MTNKGDDVVADRIECNWCGAYNLKERRSEDGVLVCFKCGLSIRPANIANETGKGKGGKGRVVGGKDRRTSKKRDVFVTELTGEPVVGIDPGARYTAVVVRDADVPLLSSTLVRPDDMSGTEWAVFVVDSVKTLLAENGWESIPMGVEGISDPKGFYRGKHASINPKDIIRAGMVLGAVCATWRDAHIIPPGDNGSQHLSHYPDSLKGRRPKDLPGSSEGAGTRNHEKSAYDVAGKTIKILEKFKREKFRVKPDFGS